MPLTRDPALPQHDMHQGHYGSLPFSALPSGSQDGQVITFVSGVPVIDWRVGWPLLLREDGADEGRVYIIDFTGPGVDVAYTGSGRAQVNVASGSVGSVGGLNFVIGDGVNVITTGEKGHIRWPFSGTLQRASLLSLISGSIVVDIWKDSYANHQPNSADSITASAKPTLSSANKSEDTTLTGWVKTFVEGDIYAFNVDSATTVTRVTLELKYQRNT